MNTENMGQKESALAKGQKRIGKDRKWKPNEERIGTKGRWS